MVNQIVISLHLCQAFWHEDFFNARLFVKLINFNPFILILKINICHGNYYLITIIADFSEDLVIYCPHCGIEVSMYL